MTGPRTSPADVSRVGLPLLLARAGHASGRARALLEQYGRLEQGMAHYKRAAEIDPSAHQALEELRGFNKRPDREGRRLLSLFRKKKGMD